ncbi:two-component sensor histidine kinase [Planotetraspora silvatica]|uniref:histidine kinase n=1 Tax=Planotetraspora silvatica TaxID=234614 RepID=A0A8J3UQ39_9ACTN|nr:sensor histidine kinase [Planotetraspora silvatica]GII49268.1 two-component sensor histidine kinase [Planotetraspora silvatica]
MQVTPSFPVLERVPPGVWTILAWCAGAAVLPGVLYRWDGLMTLAIATALVLVGSALLHRRPLAALTLLIAASALVSFPLSSGEIPLFQFLAVDVALYFIAATRSRRVGVSTVAMALAVLVGYLATQVLLGWDIGTSWESAVVLAAVIAWLIGNSVRQAREYAESLSAQAAARAVSDERLRIARELHDMVAHNIGIVALQAGAARRVIDTQPAQARDALGEIETASRETLSGLRRMLGALRQAEPATASQTLPLEPGLRLADVDRLAATTTDAGVRVDVRRRGEHRPLPPEIDMSAYRIIQEAITNVVRHAGTDFCCVSIDYRAEEISIEVLDDGQGVPTTAGSGYGLLGMRERVGLLHGEFSAGPRAEGGFRVAARLPVPAEVR